MTNLTPCDLCYKKERDVYPFKGGTYCQPCIIDMVNNAYDDDEDAEEDDFIGMGYHIVFAPEKPKDGIVGIPSHIKNDNKPEEEESPMQLEETPEIIKAELDKYVIGQDDAKIQVANSLYNHMIRFFYGSEMRKSNVMLVGPSGSGKTLLAESLAKIMGVPFLSVNITEYTENGYVGRQVQDIFPALVEEGNYSSHANYGIIFIDEVDKLATKAKYNTEKGHSVSQKGVQRELLKLLEGEVKFKMKGTEFSTKNVLFILAGAFADRIKKEDIKASIGFENKVSEEELPLDNLHKELIDYGMMAELIGRIPVIAELNYLSDEEMVKTITEPKDAIINDYITYFKATGSKITFEKKGLILLVQNAKKLGTGVRGIRSILANVLKEPLFKVPGFKEPTNVVLTAKNNEFEIKYKKI